MAKGLGRIPAIGGTLMHARGEPGLGRHWPASGPADRPGQGMAAQGTRAGSPPSRPGRGLAPGARGWPWHPRRLATARHRGAQGS
jgi:hypothetical protein